MPEGRIGRKGKSGPLFFSSFLSSLFALQCKGVTWTGDFYLARPITLCCCDSRRNRARGKEREEMNEWKKEWTRLSFSGGHFLTEKKRRVLPRGATVLQTGHTGVCCFSVSQSFTERGRVQCRSETHVDFSRLQLCIICYCITKVILCVLWVSVIVERAWCVCVAGSAQGLRRSSAAAKTE